MSENDRLAEIRKRCEAATPGPWNWDVQDEATMLLGTEGLEAFEGAVLAVERCEHCRERDPENAPCSWPRLPNADFIEHSREDVPWLLAEAERLRAENAALRQERDAAESRAAYLDVDRGLLEKAWEQAKADRLRLDGAVTALMAERDRLRAALRTYGATHTWDCQSTHGTGLACDCGFDALMKEPTDGD